MEKDTERASQALPLLMTVRHVAEELSVTERHVRALLAEGKLTPKWIGTGRRYVRVTSQSVLDCVAAMPEDQQTEADS